MSQPYRITIADDVDVFPNENYVVTDAYTDVVAVCQTKRIAEYVMFGLFCVTPGEAGIEDFELGVWYRSRDGDVPAPDHDYDPEVVYEDDEDEDE